MVETGSTAGSMAPQPQTAGPSRERRTAARTSSTSSSNTEDRRDNARSSPNPLTRGVDNATRLAATHERIAELKKLVRAEETIRRLEEQ